MAWLAVNKDSEYGLVFDEKLQRVGIHWEVIEDLLSRGEFGIRIEMKSVVKLIGRRMYWENFPIEI